MQTRSPLWPLVGGAGLGMLGMYVFDPAVGRRRRAVVRDKMVHLSLQAADGIDKAAHDTAHRAYGLWWRARKRFQREEVPDDVLVERVRSRLGRSVSHPHAIEVSARDGVVILHGPILSAEVRRLLEAVRGIPGVRDVIDELEPHKTANGVPALQGGKKRIGESPDLLHENWAPSTRLFAVLGGAALLGLARKRRGLAGDLLGLKGLALAARGLTNMRFKRLLGIGAGRRAVDLHKTLHILAPADEVFAFWANFDNFPRFMRHVKEVRDLGDGRYRWKVSGPGGVTISWDAVLTEFVPEQLIAWKTLPHEPVQHAGMVKFMPSEDGRGTHLEVHLSYNPPAGALGHALAKILGADPKKAMDEDLLRLLTKR